jgi:chemotaxis protein methyltransferase CheR
MNFSANIELDTASFEEISRILYQHSGITLNSGKRELVKSRLAKRICATGTNCFDEYLAFVKSDVTGVELRAMIDALTTNKTSFFRESAHFDYLREILLPKMCKTSSKIRIWSAGCSTGEEPYTLGIVLREYMPEIDLKDVKILATDISDRALAYARKAEYTTDKLDGLPRELLKKYFKPVDDGENKVWRVNDSVRKLVFLARLNLVEDWIIKGPFQAIFCRNVMIYFDNPTRQRLVQRFWELLEPGGHLFIGHSESLMSLRNNFTYVKPGVYIK